MENLSLESRLFTNKVIEMGVREPEPKIFPPSFLDNSPLVRWFPRKLKT